MAPWIPVDADSHFSLANIPFGIFERPDGHPAPAVAIGDYLLDLDCFSAHNGFVYLPSFAGNVFRNASTLNGFAALGRRTHSAVRGYLQKVLASDTPYPDVLRDHAELREKALVKREHVKMRLPLEIGDYSDFYAGKRHAYNVGVLFRGPANALQPNYEHLPVGYHGRASSVVVSGTDLRRPRGQILEDPKAEVKKPVFVPARKMDMELELAVFVGVGTELGEGVMAKEAGEHIFGFVLMNDWSARDIQAWEYVPLGPFNSKNFGTSISPWVVLPDALEKYRVEALENSSSLLAYLEERDKNSVYDIQLTVSVKDKEGKGGVLTQTSGRNLLYSFPQMIAHHCVGGCNLRPGDLLGSGTISGTEQGQLGSLLEASKNGAKTVKIGDIERRFLEDGDEVIIEGWCGNNGERVGFGECRGRLLSAKPGL